MSRTVASIWVSVVALAVGSGTALADQHEGAPVAEEAAAGTGKIKAGAKIMLPSGFDEDGEIGIGSWVEVTLWGKYAVDEKITAGIAIPLMLIKPDLGPIFGEADVLQAIMVDGAYKVNDNLTGNGMVGMGVPGRLGINPWGGGFGIPGGAGDLKIGLGAGGTYTHAMDKIHVEAGAKLVVQLDSDVDDDGDEKAQIVLHVPIMAMYAVNEKLSAGVATGIYTGSDLSFDNEEGMTLPLVAGAKYGVNDQISAGGFLGFANLLTPDGLDVGDTLTLGAFLAWQQ